MGKRLIALALEDGRFDIAGAFEASDSPSIGMDCGLLAGVGEIGIPISNDGCGFDVLLDFSSPEGAAKSLEVALDQRANLVVGTTGLSPEFIDRLRLASESIGVFQASNFSYGIAATASVVAHLAKTLEGSDIEIEEMHHRNKIDAPSGTALDLAAIAARARGEDLQRVAVFGRHGKTGPRRDSEIGIHSLRGGGVIGEHRVIFSTPFETVTIEHRAISRDVFISGALEASAFIFKKIGFFGMQDLISAKGAKYA